MLYSLNNNKGHAVYLLHVGIDEGPCADYLVGVNEIPDLGHDGSLLHMHGNGLYGYICAMEVIYSCKYMYLVTRYTIWPSIGV